MAFSFSSIESASPTMTSHFHDLDVFNVALRKNQEYCEIY
jgi:hypothetical protein